MNYSEMCNECKIKSVCKESINPDDEECQIALENIGEED